MSSVGWIENSHIFLSTADELHLPLTLDEYTTKMRGKLSEKFKFTQVMPGVYCFKLVKCRSSASQSELDFCDFEMIEKWKSEEREKNLEK